MTQFARLRDFSDAQDSGLEPRIRTLASHLSTTPLSGTLGFVIKDPARATLIMADIRQAAVSEHDAIQADRRLATTPDFIVYTSRATLADILSGQLSPVAAWLSGRLRYSGKIDLGIAVFRASATDQRDVFEPCRERRSR